MVPPLAPSESTDSRLLASTSRSPAATWMRELNAIAARTNCGRRARVQIDVVRKDDRRLRTWDDTSLLRRAHDIVDRQAGRGGHGGGDRALHDRCVDQTRVAALEVLQDAANGQDRAAEVTEHDHAIALVGGVQRGGDPVGVGAEPAVRRPADALEGHVRTGHLRGEREDARRDVGAVRDDDDPDHAPESTRQDAS